jgi:hypothetical protein
MKASPKPVGGLSLCEIQPFRPTMLDAYSQETAMPDEPDYKTLERRGEEIYAAMYEGGSPLGLLSEIKECFAAAIAAAEVSGLAAEAARLRARLDHIVTVYRRQFT